MEDFLKRSLNLEKLQYLGVCSGGCISDSKVYNTDFGKLFVKQNSEKEAWQMMKGEFESLSAISDTKTLRVPQPKHVLPHPSGQGGVLVVEYLEMRYLSKYQARLGEDLAKLHLHNQTLLSKDSKIESREDSEPKYVEKFGFHTATCCGIIPQENDWCSDWVEFYTRQRLKPQIDLVMKKEGNRQLMELWSHLERRIPHFFDGITIQPSLLHGDLWSGNVSETDADPVAYDPASFYGHSEYDFGIAGMFGGFSKEFYNSYHRLIPKSPGFDERHQLYLLFHNLNHWNHFGSTYSSGTLSIMRKLVK